MSEESVKSVIVPSEVVDVDELLVLVQSRPEIYDMSRKEHHNQDFMSKVWNEVGRELNVPASNAVKFLIVTHDGVRLYNVGGDYKNVVLLQDMVKDVDYHFTRNDVYVMTYRQIIRTRLEGRSTQNYTVIADPEDEYRFTSLAVDWVHDVLYWTSGPVLVIHQACLNGSEERIILRCCYIEKHINKLLVDPYVGRLFWMTNNEVHSANLQGKKYKKDIFPQISSVRDIALDVSRQRIYFLAAFSGDDTWFITSSGYDGGCLKWHVQAPRVTYGLGAHGGEVYFIPHEEDSCIWEGNDVYRHRFTLYSASTEDNSTARPLLMFPEPVWNLRVIQPDLKEGNSSHGTCT